MRRGQHRIRRRKPSPAPVKRLRMTQEEFANYADMLWAVAKTCERNPDGDAYVYRYTWNGGSA